MDETPGLRSVLVLYSTCINSLYIITGQVLYGCAMALVGSCNENLNHHLLVQIDSCTAHSCLRACSCFQNISLWEVT